MYTVFEKNVNQYPFRGTRNAHITNFYQKSVETRHTISPLSREIHEWTMLIFDAILEWTLSEI